jgi:hypothetical protein
MGISDRVNQITASLQNTTKSTFSSLLAITLKAGSSFLISFVVALIVQTIVGFGQFSFLLSLIVGTSLLMRLMWTWSIGATLIFNLVCALVALLLRMYILVAP